MRREKRLPVRWLVVAIIATLLIGGQGVLAQDENCNPGSLANGWPDTDFCQVSIDLADIISGGPPKDGIPAIDAPNFDTIEQAQEWLVEQSPVIAVEIDGEAKAYPLAVLTWHEIANDEISGVPISVTFCPLCNSSIVFDRRVDGDVLDFGVSGKLRNSDMIMYDRQTESWWQQFIGEAVVGELNGTILDVVPSQVVGFGQFIEQFPDGLVLNRDTGENRQYGVNPYTGYDSSTRPFLFRGELDDRLPPTERVLAGIVDGEAIAYPFANLSEEGAINDTIGEQDIVAFWQPGVTSALDANLIDESRDIGTAAVFNRTLEDGQTLTFSSVDNIITDDETGSTWNAFGTAIDGELAGTQLQQLVATPHFWFAWAAFQPETSVYGI